MPDDTRQLSRQEALDRVAVLRRQLTGGPPLTDEVVDPDLFGGYDDGAYPPDDERTD